MALPMTSRGEHQSGSVSSGPTLIVHGRHHRTTLWRRLRGELQTLGAAQVLVWGLVAVLAMVMAALAGLCAAYQQTLSAVAFGAGSLTGCIAFSLFIRYRP